MARNNTDLHRVVFENKFRKLRRTEFQAFFADIMSAAYPRDFIPIRISRGDGKCDGFRKKTGTIYQVYAPRSTTPSELGRKIKSDFADAKGKFSKILRSWIFVHNDTDGIDHETLHLLLAEIETENPGITIEAWSEEELWRIVSEDLPDEARRRILSTPCSDYIDHESPSTVQIDSETISTSSTLDSARVLPSESPALSQVLAEQVDAQAETIRQYLDKEGRDLWDSARRLLKEGSIQKALVKGKELESWLDTKALNIGDELRGRISVFLANLALIEESQRTLRKDIDTRRARSYLEHAKSAIVRQPSEELAERLIALEAKLDCAEGRTDKAISDISGYGKGIVFATHLAILVDQSRFREVTELLEDKDMHILVCDEAVYAYTRIGEIAKANAWIEWAKSQDGIAHLKARLMFSTAIVIGMQELLTRERRVPPTHLSKSERQSLEDAVNTLQPILSGPEATNRIETGMEANALSIAIGATMLLGDMESCRRFCDTLRLYRPINLTYAKAVLNGITETTEDLPDLLRQDHPDSRVALELAASIEGTCLGRSNAACESFQDLIEHTENREEKERLCELLSEHWGPIRVDEPAEIEAYLEEQLDRNHRLIVLRRAAKTMLTGEIERAVLMLEDIRDPHDPLWLQIWARTQFEAGNKSVAAESLMEAARIVPRLDVFHTAAYVADIAERWDLLEDVLQWIVQKDPKDQSAWSRLAFLYIGRHKFAESVSCFEILRTLRPDDFATSINLAVSLQCTGRLEDSLAVYNELCEREQVRVEALIRRAAILREMGRADQAFRSLKDHVESNQDSEDFLLAFVQLGYAAGEDSAAHRAILRLLELQEAGRISPEKFRAFSREDVREHESDYGKATKMVNEAILAGRESWLFAEHISGLPAYLGWRSRTQDVLVLDNQQDRAHFTVYATHCFCRVASEDSRSTLEKIARPQRGGVVVADLTALITLHRLGLIEKANEYFDAMYIPSVYIPAMSRDVANLATQQRSTRDACRSVIRAVDIGKIHVFRDPQQPGKSDLAIVSEYQDHTECGDCPYRLADLYGWMHSQGKTSRKTHADAMETAHRSSANVATPIGTAIARGALIDTETLKTIASVGLLERLLSLTRIHVRQNHLRELREELQRDAERAKILASHKDLAAILKNEKRFQRIPTMHPENVMRDSATLPDDVSTISLQIAIEQGITLLVDDRACQAEAFGRNRKATNAAIGTDALLGGLFEANMLSRAELATHYLTLMRLRYRFLLPPIEVLMELALNYRDHPPGQPMIEIARYMHDCMRDPGLCAGPEPTDPPLPLALAYGQAWAWRIGKLIYKIGSDQSYGNDEYEALIYWIVTRFLPSPSPKLSPMLRYNMASAIPLTIINSVATHAALDGENTRGNRTLVTIKNAMRITDAEYIRLIGNTIDVNT